MKIKYIKDNNGSDFPLLAKWAPPLFGSILIWKCLRSYVKKIQGISTKRGETFVYTFDLNMFFNIFIQKF